MSAINKPEQLRIRVTHADSAWLDEICAPSLNRNDVASVLLDAAIKAIRDNRDAFLMPLRFRVSQDEEIRAPLPKRKAS